MEPVPAAEVPLEAAAAEEVPVVERSEEHTSELQSPCNLVCRLLLEKKKTRYLSCISSPPSRSPAETPSRPSRSRPSTPAHRPLMSIRRPATSSAQSASTDVFPAHVH